MGGWEREEGEWVGGGEAYLLRAPASVWLWLGSFIRHVVRRESVVHRILMVLNL